MSVVIDASVLAAALMNPGPAGVWAETVVGSGDLLAPALLPVECANVLRRLEASGKLAASEATAAFRDMISLDVSLLPFEPFAERVWELRSNLTAYDAWYVAVAEAFGVPLATLDEKLARAPGPRCKFLLYP